MTEPAPPTPPQGRAPVNEPTAPVRGRALVTNWGRTDWFAATALLLGVVALVLVVCGITKWEAGSAAEWFSGLASSAAVGVALWQSIIIRKQAETQLEHEREAARTERAATRERAFKFALIDVAEALTAYKRELEDLVTGTERGDFAASTTQERIDALEPHRLRLRTLNEGIKVEISKAHLSNVDREISEAVNELNAAVGDAAKDHDKFIQAASWSNPAVLANPVTIWRHTADGLDAKWRRAYELALSRLRSGLD